MRARLPWGSVVTLEHGDHQVHRIAGQMERCAPGSSPRLRGEVGWGALCPLVSESDGWALPVLWPDEGEPSKRDCQSKAGKLRRELGLEPRHTG